MRELKRYKEELVALVLLSLVLLAVRWLSIHYWSGDVQLDALGNPLPGEEGKLPFQYDLRSQTETIAWTVLRMVIYSLCAWLCLRVTMPTAYDWLKRRFDFKALSEEQKLNVSLRLFAIFLFCLVGLHMSGATRSTRECVIASAMADLQVRELTGNNDGPRIAQYQRHVKAPLRSSYCAAFVSFHLSACGVPNPMSAWSPAYASTNDRVWTPRKAVRDPLPADVCTMYYAHLGRVGHAGFVLAKEGRFILTIEGNTSGGGSRDGDGVYKRKRELSKVYAITNYIHDDASTTTHTHRRATPARMQGTTTETFHAGDQGQRGGTLRTEGYSCLDHAGQRQRSGGTASARTRPGTRDQYQGHSQGIARGAQRCGDRHVQLGQPRLQDAAVGEVDPREQHTKGGREGEAGGSSDTALGLVAAHCMRGTYGLALPQATASPGNARSKTHIKTPSLV